MENRAAVWTQGHPTEKRSQFLDIVSNTLCMPLTRLVDFLEPIDNLGNRRDILESLQIVNFETSFISRFLETLDPHTQLLLKFTVKNLLESEHFVSLAPFAGIFQSLEKKVPGLVPPLGLAVSKLSQQSPLGQSTSGGELNLSQQTRFFNSKIFQSFRKARCAAQDQGERFPKGAPTATHSRFTPQPAIATRINYSYIFSRGSYEPSFATRYRKSGQPQHPMV